MSAAESVETGAHEHDWIVIEYGYVRIWATQISIDDDGVETVTATYGGSEDFSETGDGETLACSECGQWREMPENVVWN